MLCLWEGYRVLPHVVFVNLMERVPLTRKKHFDPEISYFWLSNSIKSSKEKAVFESEKDLSPTQAGRLLKTVPKVITNLQYATAKKGDWKSEDSAVQLLEIILKSQKACREVRESSVFVSNLENCSKAWGRLIWRLTWVYVQWELHNSLKIASKLGYRLISRVFLTCCQFLNDLLKLPEFNW